ncbi:MAG: hypothetical protein GF344_13280 [Chitinivibrionales bacterium]|nr:hypothetical protein [Chitinivibrionales bacterium]
MQSVDIIKCFSPDILDGYFGLIKNLERRCPFDGKTKELILLGILTGKQSEHGITVHVERALAHGATTEEIITVIVSALPACGMGAVIKALDQAKELLDLSEYKKTIERTKVA